jgi:hypothetical protein
MREDIFRVCFDESQLNGLLLAGMRQKSGALHVTIRWKV